MTRLYNTGMGEYPYKANAMHFREKIASIRSQIYVGKTVDLLPYGIKYISDIIRLRNQSGAKYFLTQEHDITEEQQVAWIKSYEQSTKEFGFIVRNKRNETVGISFCYNYDGSAMEIGRATFDTARVVGMPYALETYMVSVDLVFNYLEVPLMRSIIKSDNHALLKFYRKMNWRNTGTRIIRGQKYEEMQFHKSDCNHAQFQYILEARQRKPQP